MSMSHRLSSLEESMMSHNEAGEAGSAPPHSLSDFEAEDDPEQLVRMFNAMDGHWHQVGGEQAAVLERLSKKQLREIIDGGFIDTRQLSDRQIDRLAEGDRVEDVLGANWQREYGYSRADPS